MAINPVSFGSLLVYTIKDGKPKADVPSLVKTSFRFNKELSKYNIQDTYSHEEELDGTIHNAMKDFALYLDDKHQKALHKNSKNVILSDAYFTVNPRESEKRYFLTAATQNDENLVLNVLNRGSVLYAVRFR